MLGKRLFGQAVQRAALSILLELKVPLLGIESRKPRAQFVELRRGERGNFLFKTFETGHVGDLAGNARLHQGVQRQRIRRRPWV